jgi:hypothetical protein
VRLKGLGHLKNAVTSLGIEPACSIVPQIMKDVFSIRFEKIE